MQADARVKLDIQSRLRLKRRLSLTRVTWVALFSGSATKLHFATRGRKLHDSVCIAHPGLILDGVLVEAMARRGIEMVVGARRDAQWGPILVVGLGGVWVEAMGDVCLIPASASEGEIHASLSQTRGAKILRGLRGQRPSDIDAVVQKLSV